MYTLGRVVIAQGHVRVGTDLVSDPAYLVTREMEDYVTWVDSSKIKRHIMKYNDALDDYDLLGEQSCLFHKWRFVTRFNVFLCHRFHVSLFFVTILPFRTVVESRNRSAGLEIAEK